MPSLETSFFDRLRLQIEGFATSFPPLQCRIFVFLGYCLMNTQQMRRRNLY